MIIFSMCLKVILNQYMQDEMKGESNLFSQRNFIFMIFLAGEVTGSDVK